VLLCSLSTVVFLALSGLGLTYLTTFIGSLVGVMSACFLAECVLSPPDVRATIEGTLVPSLPPGSAQIAVALLGAVAMPHNLFLQSALVLDKSVRRERRSIQYACAYTSVETSLALLVSFFINTSVLLVAASGFAPHWCASLDKVCSVSKEQCPSATPDACYEVGLETAGQLLERLIGPRASALWAIALLASGQSSTITGTYAGQFVMQGFVDLSLPLWARNLASRLVAIVPSLLVTVIMGPKGANDLILFASIVLSLHLPLALVPLLKFTDSPLKMGTCANGGLTSLVAWLLTCIVIAANMSLVWTSAIAPLLIQPEQHLTRLSLSAALVLAYFALLSYLVLVPVSRRCDLPESIYVGSRAELAAAAEVSEPLLASSG